MNEIVSKNKCSGCHSCFNICPKSAIEMKEDDRGFKYPVIDQKKCINCGLCKKVCPIINIKEEKKKIDSYACYNLNLHDRMNSSSGGIFILIAKEILKRNGVVFGAIFDNDFNVIHSYVENENELINLMGSKYTQSSIDNSYEKAKEFLDNGKYVLFTGTPCQIEGLLSFLKKDYERLYTQDIVCHGVPSPKVWRKYLDFQKKIFKEKIRNVQFRNKDHGWSLYRTKILFDTRTYSRPFNEDLYMKVFLSNICLRDSCYNCSFKKMYRVSDITLADYWGITKVHPEFNDDKGSSLVIVNSNKGRELFNNIKDDIKYIETDLNEALKYNSAMVKSASHCDNEDVFIENIDNISFDKLVAKYVPHSSFIKRLLSFIKHKIIK